ncbi:hypothetical protein [Micrococcus sp. HSID17245]|uniref:hypothetical protein n=1 Tax=Micrococcus sp. HSID17245 TaxID=2419508 RepID=UPI001EE7F5FC|nr:hypothetical protein [Micrococcus sp. HSID17245]
MIAVAVGVFLLVAWTVGGWAIVRMGFTRDGDAARTPAHDDGAKRPAHPGAAADPATDPHLIWREQMKAATAASGAQCLCPPPPREAGAAEAGTTAPPSSPDCPIHRWDYA